MKKIILAASLGLSLTTQAYVSVVKVIGNNCNTKKVEVAGSGVVFNENGQQYLMTSEHVAPQDSKLCYNGASASSKESKMTLISSDWESGLALFKIENPLTNDKTTLQDFVSPQGQPNEAVRALGFASEEYGQINDKARVTTLASDRTAFVNSGKNIEVAGITNEHGLSGGALADEQGHKVLGILSHQRIRANPGSSSQVIQLAQNAQQDVMLLAAVAIPGDRAKKWADDTINNNLRPNYSRDKNNRIRGNGLEFQEKRFITDPQQLKSEERRLEDKDTRIDSLRLGGDGVGIGGRPGQEPIVLQISLTNLSQLHEANQNLPEVRWISKLSHTLVENPTLRVRGLVVFSSDGEIRVESIFSTADFLRKMRSGYGYPLLENKQHAKIGADSASANIEAILNMQNDSEEVISLIEKIKAIEALRLQYPQLKIPDNYIKNLSAHPGWDELAEDFDTVVQLKTYLQKLQTP